MKKISVLVMLILCVTIGGVYAAWSYTGTTVSTAERTLSHGMATATTEGDVGILKVIHNDIDIKIDQTATGNYNANLVITGSIQVSFTPNPGAPDDVVDNAVSAKCVLSVNNADANPYEGNPIYVASADEIDLVWEKQDDGTFLATVSAAQVDSILDLGATFNLDTHEKWTEFHALEKNITITAQFSQKN